MSQVKSLTTVLIANRGEIACRIMRTAKAMGLNTVAVYSDADAGALHVKMADQSYRLGPAPVGESYLRIDKIIEAAEATGAEAIHPGYGFLSENAELARACAKEGITFVGPDPDAIELMGDKAKAKRRMIDAGVPCVPGYQGEDQSNSVLIAEAEKIGFPLMVKAAAGGGGRGMRLVENAGGLPNAIQSARSEAENAFGSGELILERAILQPRHVEIQVFADRHGNTIHLGERDCSVQRRHQKVLEEAPCPVMTPELREAMGAAAVKAARDISYVGAGTVEFLLDADGNFYFLEMNTRLQVEHPVTEMVTGIDLVELQLRIAQGDALKLKQQEINFNGHAIEARLYAEDTTAGFLPATGPVDLWRPAQGSDIRTDSGIETGTTVSPYYDPMIAKVIAHGNTRDEARMRLMNALNETTLFGVSSNRSFLVQALEHPVFTDGAATTAFIPENFGTDDLAPKQLSFQDAAVAAVLQYIADRNANSVKSVSLVPELLNWSSASLVSTPYSYKCGDVIQNVSITATGNDTYLARNAEAAVDISIQSHTDQMAHLVIDGEQIRVVHNQPPNSSGESIQLAIGAQDFVLTNVNAVFTEAAGAAGAGSIVAPMHGALLEVFVEEGQSVAKGDRLAVLEAMKMQHEIEADIAGTVKSIHFAAGAQVEADRLLIEIGAND